MNWNALLSNVSTLSHHRQVVVGIPGYFNGKSTKITMRDCKMKIDLLNFHV